jgi:glycosyltransferase involved in cell wall biosynthesis
LIEAMACGLACVVVDYGGPGQLIDSGRGVKVTLGTKDQLVDDFARELSALVADPARVASLGASAREYATTHYTWDAKARRMVEVYRWALEQRAEEPAFDRP